MYLVTPPQAVREGRALESNPEGLLMAGSHMQYASQCASV